MMFVSSSFGALERGRKHTVGGWSGCDGGRRCVNVKAKRCLWMSAEENGNGKTSARKADTKGRKSSSSGSGNRNGSSRIPSNGNGSGSSGKVLGKVVAIGLSHNTASVDVREKLSVPEPEWNDAAAALVRESDSILEAAVLSTCNRFEVYLCCDDIFRGTLEATAFLSKRSGVPLSQLRAVLFVLPEDEAVWHLLRVSAGLDSLVVGEGQILSQVRRCFEVSTSDGGSARKILSRLLNVAVSAGRRVRSETDIAKGAVSISSAAVELAALKAPPVLNLQLRDTRVAIIGAGKMARLLAQHLSSRGLSTVLNVVNRSKERSEELAKMVPDVELALHSMDAMIDVVRSVDVVFTSTGATEPILTKENLEVERSGQDEDERDDAQEKEKKTMLIDISVPRNVASDVGEVDGMVVFNVDDLKAVVARNQARRKKLSVQAEVLLKEELVDFRNWHHSLGSVPAITKLQERAEGIRHDELEKLSGKLASLTDQEREAVERVTKGIVNKILHGPMAHIRTLQDVKERTQTLRSLEAMFQLD